MSTETCPPPSSRKPRSRADAPIPLALEGDDDDDDDDNDDGDDDDDDDDHADDEDVVTTSQPTRLGIAPPPHRRVILAPRDTNYNVQRPECEVDDHECAKRCSVMKMSCRCKVAQHLKHFS